MAIIVGALIFLSMVNSLSGVLYSVPTIMSPTFFLVIMIIAGVFTGLIVEGITLLVAGAGKNISKEVLDFDVIRDITKACPDREGPKYSTFRSFCLAFILLGIATLFYLVGSKFFGVWMPENSTYISAVSAYAPALIALTTGAIAAIGEETIFRLFSVPFLKCLKYTVLVVFLSSLIWGVGHLAHVGSLGTPG